MRIGVFRSGWWKEACDRLGHATVDLPVPHHPNGPYAADLAARKVSGSGLPGLLGDAPPDLLLDNGGAGLGFVEGPGGADDLRIAHEAAGLPLCSHFIDPLVTCFQGLEWPTVWQCLRSRSWIKAVWDRAQAAELRNFGIPNVIHLPMAAPEREYDTTPINPDACVNAVSFVGGQNTSFFSANNQIPSRYLLPGTLGQAVRSDLRGATFHDVYHELYGLGTPIGPEDDLPTQIRKSHEYFSAKLFFNAALCISNRDRFIIFLKRKLGDTFRLIGRGWDTAYGLHAEPSLPGLDAFFNHFRETAINISLINGNTETGLNMRCFEITAAGGFMLCHDQPELCQHFEVGRECDVFRGEAELLDKIQHYLSHPEERVAIARAGQQRTLSQHLYRHRLETLLSLLRSHLPVAGRTTTGVAREATSVP